MPWAWRNAVGLYRTYFFWLNKNIPFKKLVLFLHIFSKIVLKHVLFCMSEERLIISTSV